MEMTTKKLIFGDCPIDIEKYEEIRDELQKFGMTQNQVKVFFYLGKFGSKTAIEISRSLQMPRTETYHLLTALQNKGMILTSFDHPTKFSSVPLDKAIFALVNTESERLNSLKKSEPILKKLWSSIPDMGKELAEQEEKFQTLRGGNQVNSKIIDMISRAENEFLILGCEKDFLKFYHANFLDAFKNNSVDFKFLTAASEKSWYIFDDIDKSKVKKLPVSVKDNLCFLIKDEKEMILFVKKANDTDKEVTAFWTNSESMIYSNILLFKNLWSKSKPILQ